LTRVGAALVFALVIRVSGEAENIDASAWDKEVAQRVSKGGFVFAKFFAPWCGHCKKLKPDWDKLADKFNYKSNALIIDVDCTDDKAKSLCETQGVQGYPTLKTFSPLSPDGESYEGGRELKDLVKFTKQNSKKPCVVDTLDNCNKKDKAYLEEIKDLDMDKLKEQKDTFDGEITSLKEKEKEERELFEKQKEEAMATMKRADDLKKQVEKLQGKIGYKLHILKEKTKGGVKEEL